MKKDEIIITNYSLEAERAVLGSVLIYKNSIEDVFSKILDVNYFYVPTHQLIFSLMKELKANDRLIDVISLTDLAKVKGNIDDIGYMYIVDLMDNAPPSTELVSNSLEIILDKFRRRTLLSDLSTLKDNIETTTGLSKFTDLVNEHQGNLFDLLNLNHTKGARHIETAVIDLSLKYEELKKGNMKVIENQFTKSGFSNLDDMITGLKNGSLVILASRPAQGKMESLDNMIVTPNGKIRMGDIKVGQKICGSDGKVYDVTGVFPHGMKDSYRVYFDDDTFVDCGLEHLWEVTTRADRKASKKRFSVLNTGQMMDNLYLPDGRKNYAIKIPEPVYFESQEITLNPYVLGVYLGDGYNPNEANHCLITNSEPDVINKFKYLLPDSDDLVIGMKDHRIKRKKFNATPSDFYKELKKIGLTGKKSYEKFIPKNYIYNSIEVRLELLRGLIDTDGYIVANGKNHIEYSTTSQQLADDILELVRSLGGKATYKEKQGAYRKNGKRIEVRKYYRLTLSFPESIIPVSSKKHLAKFSTTKKFHKKYITKIEPVGQTEMQCISVNSPDNLYITEGYNLTHNTAMMLNIATNIAKTGLPVVIFSLEMLANELTERIITSEAEINTYQINNGIADWDKLKTSTEKVKQLPIFIQDTTLKNVSEIYSQVLKIKNKYKRIGAVFLDYIQLIDTGEDDATQNLTKISRALKLMAMDLDVPVVALSQLSRAVEQRANKRPILSDLRQSGSLEQDADQVFFLYRDEYYNPDTDKKRIAEFIIAKFRGGAVGTVEMYFDPFITKFTDLEKV